MIEWRTVSSAVRMFHLRNYWTYWPYLVLGLTFKVVRKI